MNKTSFLRTVGALVIGVAVAGAPALSYAQHSGGGGGHIGGGGGGAQFGGGGGAHFGGAGGAHYGGARYMGHGGALGGGYAAAAGHYGATHGYAATHYAAGYTAGRISAPVVAHGAGFAAGRVYYGHGVWAPGHAWVGGYWHGVFWPRCWFYPGFSWWLGALPIGYATFWWGGVPYYYYNNLYYTYSPADSGYVVTEPPPAAGGDDSGDPGQAAGTAGEPATPAPPAGSAANIYLYPRNGQSDQQMANDRYECHSWAVGQTGFDPTRGGAQSGSPDDYRRAMISCLDARGYSAR